MSSERIAARAGALLAALVLAACDPRVPDPGPTPEACPTRSAALTDVRSLDPSIAAELRYATPDNFTGAPLPGYDAEYLLLRPDAAEALARVQARLRPHGLGLRVWDAYRPVRATRAMVEWAERTGNEWVLEQGYVARRSGHNRGATVDLTLVRLDTGEELEMGTPYDRFSEAAHTANAVGRVRENRERLLRAMEAEGWTNYPKEWWHFSHAGEWEPLDLPLRCFATTGPVGLVR